MKKPRIFSGLLIAVVLAATGAAGTAAQNVKVVTYGADLNEAGRQELAQLFGVDAATQTAVVTTPEMVNTLRGTGLPVAATDRSISSSMLTCLNRGDGLTVRTQNITRITAPVYANALVTAGVGDGNVLIAAPSNNPVTGETALAGVLKAFPQCQAGRPPDPARVGLAYEQIARTLSLAGGQGERITAASTVLLSAAQPVILGQARDEAAVGAALDRAAAGSNLVIDPVQRRETVTFLQKLASLDWGSYARGYQVQTVSPAEVRVLPAGAGAAGSGAQTGAGAAAATPAAAAPNPAPATGGALTGEVTARGNDALTVRADGEDRRVSAAPGVTVTRDGRAASLGDLRDGDTVTVTTNPDGSAQRIDAASDDDGSSPWVWLVPLLLLLLLLPLLWWLLTKRRRNDFILEPNTGGTTDGGRSSGS